MFLVFLPWAILSWLALLPNPATVKGQPTYLDHYDDAYNDTYFGGTYGYDTSYFATNVQDPYDETKSWSIEHEQQQQQQQCPGGQCDTVMPTATGPNDPQEQFSEGFVNTLYMYDNCELSGSTYLINGTRDCDLEIKGVDAAADLLAGGVDGRYKLMGCFEGKPLYNRVDGPVGEDRALFYNPYIGDWEVSIGYEPNEDQLVMYGDYGQVSPLDVPRWHISASFSSVESKFLPAEDDDLYFIALGVTTACVGEAHVSKPQGSAPTQPGQSHRHSSLRLKEEDLAVGGYEEDADWHNEYGGAAEGAEYGGGTAGGAEGEYEGAGEGEYRPVGEEEVLRYYEEAGEEAY